MSRRPRDAQATRQLVLDAAEALFTSNGYGSTSLAHIASQCGINKSLILHHFDSKEGLWQAVKERKLSGFVDEQKALFSRRAVSLDDFRSSAEAYFRLLQDDPVLVQLLARAQLEQDLSCSQYDESRLAPFVQRFREAQEAGLLRDDVPPAHLLLILMNVITQWFEARAMFSSWSEMYSSNMDEHFLDSVMKVLFEGALAQPGAPR